ncbi:MAG TPA: YbhB/YbcL family Raf kinase inhibitor-like protein [Terriglobia bacterium]|nr:YbhB/YbcL family Raf kinase inhibitor-like protein [Terriglobia bacterium]
MRDSSPPSDTIGKRQSPFRALPARWISILRRASIVGGMPVAGWIIVGSALLLWGRPQTTPQSALPQPAPPPAVNLSLTASSFRANGEIPARFSCDGDDTSPALSWTDPPAGTKTFALAMLDADAPGGNFVHWIIYDLPAAARALPEGIAQGADAAGGHQGTNGFGKLGYNGPCPPPGSGHRYVFHLFALDSALDLEHATVQDLQSAMKGHILARGDAVGFYRR